MMISNKVQILFDHNKKFLFGLLLFAAILLVGNFIAQRIMAVPKRIETVLFVVFAIAIPVLKRPQIGFYYLFIIPPFIPLLRRLYYLLYARPNIDLIFMISDVVLFFILAGLYLDRRNKENPQLESNFLYKLVGITIFYQLVRVFALNAYGIKEGIFHFKLNGFYFALFFVTIYLVNEIETIKKIFMVTLFAGLLTALYSIKQIVLGYALFEQLWINSITFTTLFIEGIARPFSTLSSPAAFADHMIICIFITLGICVFNLSKFRWLFLLPLPFYVAGLLFTSVRSNWLGGIIGLAFMFLFLHVRNNRKRIVLLCCLIPAYFGLNSVPGINQTDDLVTYENLQRLTAEDQDGESLVEIFVKQRTSALTNPLGERSMVHRYGIWLGIWWVAKGSVRGALGFGMGRYPAHNYYLGFLHNGGWIGFTLIMTIMVFMFYFGIKVHDELTGEKKNVAKILLSVLFVISLINLTGQHAETHPADIYLWSFFALLMRLRWLPTSEELIKRDKKSLRNYAPA